MTLETHMKLQDFIFQNITTAFSEVSFLQSSQALLLAEKEVSRQPSTDAG